MNSAYYINCVNEYLMNSAYYVSINITVYNFIFDDRIKGRNSVIFNDVIQKESLLAYFIILGHIISWTESKVVPRERLK